jgi:hypothetical protein
LGSRRRAERERHELRHERLHLAIGDREVEGGVGRPAPGTGAPRTGRGLIQCRRGCARSRPDVAPPGTTVRVDVILLLSHAPQEGLRHESRSGSFSLGSSWWRGRCRSWPSSVSARSLREATIPLVAGVGELTLTLSGSRDGAARPVSRDPPTAPGHLRDALSASPLSTMPPSPACRPTRPRFLGHGLWRWPPGCCSARVTPWSGARRRCLCATPSPVRPHEDGERRGLPRRSARVTSNIVGASVR